MQQRKKKRWNENRKRMTTKEVQEEKSKRAAKESTRWNEKRMTMSPQEVQEDKSKLAEKQKKNGIEIEKE